MQLKIPKFKLIPLVVGMLLAPAGIANAGTFTSDPPLESGYYWETKTDTLTYNSFFENKQAGFTDTLQLQQFDSSRGTLKSITLDFSGYLNNIWGVENLDTSNQQTFTALSDASLTLKALGGLGDSWQPTQGDEPILSLQKEINATLGAYDGTKDNAGTSGKTIENSAEKTNPSLLKIDNPSQSDLAQWFIGTDTVDFSVISTDNSAADNSMNMSTLLETVASAGIGVAYEYEYKVKRQIPEPSTVLGLGVVAGLGLLRKRKKLVEER